MEKIIKKIVKVGNSYCVILPKMYYRKYFEMQTNYCELLEIDRQIIIKPHKFDKESLVEKHREKFKNSLGQKLKGYHKDGKE